MVGMRRILKIPHDKHVLLKQRIDNGLIPKQAEHKMREMLEVVTLDPPLSKQSVLIQMEEMRAQKQKSFVRKVGLPKSLRKTYMRLLKKGKVQIPEEYAGPTQTERLVKTYVEKYTEKQINLSKNNDDNESTMNDNNAMDDEQKKHELLMGDYLNKGNNKNNNKFQSSKYENLFSSSNTSSRSSYYNNPELLKTKSVVLSNAYEFAIKQLEYQSCNPDISEEDSYKAVEDLLLREDRDERVRSREVRDTFVTEQEDKIKKEQDVEKKMMDVIGDDNTTNYGIGGKENSSTSSKDENNTIPSILHNKPRIALQLSAWGDRLRQVPYKEWTIGAITALDHWIATNVLEISETNWERMLAGEEDIGTSRIKDLLVIRGSLFPETLEENLYPSSKLNDEDDEDVSMQSINQILQDLSNNNPDDEDDADILLKNINDDEDDVGANTPFSFDDDDEDILLSESTKRADIKLKLTQELQVYRNIHHNKIPYDQWSDDDITKFDTFFNDYISFFVMPHERKHLDMDETKERLLNMLPNTKDENDEFWKQLEDETTIELFLDELMKKASSKKDDEASSPTSAMKEFLNLPYQEQKDRLMTLSTLRPIYDEYGSEQNYEKFFESNKEILLKTIPMETLIQDDKDGYITSKDITSSNILDNDKDKKFKLSMDEYGNDEMYQRKKKMLDVWRLYKLKRATVEEEMFKKGELGLKYKEKDDDDDDDGNKDRRKK